MRSALFAALVLATSVVAVPSASAAEATFLDLEPLPGENTTTYPRLVNDARQAVGVAVKFDPDLFRTFEYAVRWTPDGKITKLSSPGVSQAKAINRGGVVVGNTGDNSNRKAARWGVNGKQWTLTTPAGDTSGANAINAYNVVVGWVNGGDPGVYGLPAKWDLSGKLTMLPVPAGTTSGEALYINKAGVITGAYTWNHATYFARWFPDGTYTTIYNQGGPLGMNEAGTAVGLTGVSPARTLRINPDNTAETLQESGWPKAINDAGVVLGNGESKSYLWMPGSTAPTIPSANRQWLDGLDSKNNVYGDNGRQFGRWDPAGNLTVYPNRTENEKARFEAVSPAGAAVVGTVHDGPVSPQPRLWLSPQ